jgi:Ni/Co efflux regulator RcnB
MKMKMTRIAMPLIAVAMMTAPIMMTAQSSTMSNQQSNQSTTNMQAADQNSQAYKDGIEAAKLDTVAKRTVNPTASYLYNHPPVKKAADKEAYRNTFTQGYKAALAQSGSANTGGR